MCHVGGGFKYVYEMFSVLLYFFKHKRQYTKLKKL